MSGQAEVNHQKIYVKNSFSRATRLEKIKPPTHTRQSIPPPSPGIFRLALSRGQWDLYNTIPVLQPQNHRTFKLLTFNSTMKAQRLFLFSCLVSIIAITFSISSFSIPTYLRLIFFFYTKTHFNQDQVHMGVSVSLYTAYINRQQITSLLSSVMV